MSHEEGDQDSLDYNAVCLALERANTDWGWALERETQDWGSVTLPIARLRRIRPGARCSNTGRTILETLCDRSRPLWVAETLFRRIMAIDGSTGMVERTLVEPLLCNTGELALLDVPLFEAASDLIDCPEQDDEMAALLEFALHVAARLNKRPLFVAAIARMERWRKRSGRSVINSTMDGPEGEPVTILQALLRGYHHARTILEIELPLGEMLSDLLRLSCTHTLEFPLLDSHEISIVEQHPALRAKFRDAIVFQTAQLAQELDSALSPLIPIAPLQALIRRYTFPLP